MSLLTQGKIWLYCKLGGKNCWGDRLSGILLQHKMASIFIQTVPNPKSCQLLKLVWKLIQFIFLDAVKMHQSNSCVVENSLRRTLNFLVLNLVIWGAVKQWLDVITKSQSSFIFWCYKYAFIIFIGLKVTSDSIKVTFTVNSKQFLGLRVRIPPYLRDAKLDELGHPRKMRWMLDEKVNECEN